MIRFTRFLQPQTTRHLGLNRLLQAANINRRDFGALSADAVKKVFEDSDPANIRNLAIIAHVDHGKTTLVDCLLNQAGVGSTERAMDNIDLEQERGITIMSKNTSIVYNNLKFNIVDTPGHQDFGGEVERIMSMVDSVILVVCATEGPMPQTKFVLQKALARGIKPILVVNKVDRPTARVDEVESEIFDLFCNLDASDDQLEYPTIYAAARDGWAINSLEKEKSGVKDLLDTIADFVPPPEVDTDADLKMLITQTEYNKYFGRQLIGRITSGSIKPGDRLSSIAQDGNLHEKGKVLRLVKKYGMDEIELQNAYAGDIVSLAGFSKSTVGMTLNAPGNSEVIESIPIDPPMLSLTMTLNDSPLKGQDGDKLTIAQIRDRVIAESQDDVSLQVDTSDAKSEFVTVHGRGDLHLGVLIEKMRREGFELAVTPPQVILKDGQEPYEEVIIDTDLEYVSMIIDRLNDRKGVLMNIEEQKDGRQLMTLHVPTRGLLGFRNLLTTETKGTAQLRSQYLEHGEFAGDIKKLHKGAIIQCVGKGNTTAYSLKKIMDKGVLFVGAHTPVYEGMIIGEHVLADDLEMNAVKAKATSNIRVTGAVGVDEKLTSHKVMGLEESIAYIRDDELVEVTPKHIRMRKQVLSQGQRETLRRRNKSKN